MRQVPAPVIGCQRELAPLELWRGRMCIILSRANEPHVLLPTCAALSPQTSAGSRELPSPAALVQQPVSPPPPLNSETKLTLHEIGRKGELV